LTHRKVRLHRRRRQGGGGEQCNEGLARTSRGEKPQRERELLWVKREKTGSTAIEEPSTKPGERPCFKRGKKARDFKHPKDKSPGTGKRKTRGEVARFKSSPESGEGV